MSKIEIPSYTLKEELINSISHGVGVVLSIIGIILIKNDIPSIIFCLTLVLLYLTSTIYHGVPSKFDLKKVFRVMDHSCVFLLEAGTFTPVCLGMINGIIGIIYFVIIWLITIVFVILNIVNVDKFQKISLILHLVMGWSVLLMFKIIINNAGLNIFILLILGGLIYSIGALFYKIGSNRRYMHSIFHFFCLFGSLIHYLMVYNFIK